MPNKYVRKRNTPLRGSWTAENLSYAFTAVITGEMGVNEAALSFNIPKTTLKRRLANNNLDKNVRLGPDSMLGNDAEKKLVLHIQKLQKCGFAPSRDEVRVMAFKLAERLGIKHKFNNTKGKAGSVWLQSFLRRNPEITVRKAENTSIARASGMSKEVVNKYFKELEKILQQNDLFDKPGSIYNTDETGLQLNTRAGQVLARKGSKSVPAISPAEKGETISVIACCNAEGGYLPPYCIFKGKNKKEEWRDGMPPGSQIQMSEKSAYVTSEIFLDWLTMHFLPRKPTGKVLLIVDGHTSHTNNIDTLEFAEEHGIILFCLPPHCTHYLQPLDRAFFKSLKGHFYEACRKMVHNNPNRKLNRLQFGKLLGEAWGLSATVHNGVSAFRSTGIMPLNPEAIPDYAFLTQVPSNADSGNQTDGEQNLPGPSTSTLDSPKPGPSTISNGSPSRKRNKYEDSSEFIILKDVTPGKALDEFSPVPEIKKTAKKIRVNLTSVLTSPENIERRRLLDSKKKIQKGKKILKIKPKHDHTKRSKKYKLDESSSSDSSDLTLNDLSSDGEQISDVENECVGCGEDYRVTLKKEDWIRCVICSRWLHEGCTSYSNMCQKCGVVATKK